MNLNFYLVRSSNHPGFVDSKVVIVYIMVTNRANQGDVAQWESA